MKTHIVAIISVLASFLGVSACAAGFIHPGIMHSQADLDRVKTNVLAGNQPWLGSFQVFEVNEYSQSNYVAQPTGYANTNFPNHSYQIEDDSCGAYQNALMWYITGDTNYAHEAISILNGWSYTMTNINPAANISAYIAGLKFSAAAEILRYEGSGWSAADINQCSNMLRNILYPCLQNVVSTADDNEGAGDIRGIMAIGIFCDDTNLYDEAVNAFEGNTNSINPCVAMTLYIDTNGCPGEAGRDQAHPQGGIASYEEMAQMAWNQGLDLWGYATNLQNAFEWSAAENLATNVPFSNHGTCDITYSSLSTIDQGQWTMMYEMAYNHYVVLQGYSMPYTTFLLTNRLRPEDGSRDDPGFGTLLWSLNAQTNSFPFAGTNKIVSASSGKAVEAVNGGTAQGTQMDQKTYTVGSNQQWIMTPLGGNNFYRIVNFNAQNTNVVDSGANPSQSGTDIHLWDKSGNDNQIWQIVDDGGGHVRIISRDTILMQFPITNLLWDVTGGSLANGALIEMNQTNGANSQLFTISSPLTLCNPGDLTAISSNQSVTLSWTAVAGATSYFLKRSLTNGGIYTTLTNVTMTGIQDVGLVNGTSYYYVVTATNANGESPNSAQATGTPNDLAGTPMGLTGIPGNEMATLAWNASVNSTGYNVERSTELTGPFMLMGTNMAAMTFTDTGLINGMTYYYEVSGTNEASESANSLPVSVTPGDYAGVHIEGDLIVNLQTADLSTNIAMSTWTNRSVSGNAVGNFTRNGGGNLMVTNVAYAGTNFNALFVNNNVNNAVLSTSIAPAEIAGNNPMSVEAWVYAQNWHFTSGSASTVVGYGASSKNTATRTFQFDDWHTTFRLFAGQFDDVIFSLTNSAATNLVTLNAWHLVDWVYNGSTMAVYVDTVPLTNPPTALSALATPQSLIAVGASYVTNGPAVGSPFYGCISAVRVQSGLLSANDMATNFAMGPLALVAPIVPTGLTVLPSDGQVLMAWNPSYNASGYDVKYSTIPGGPYSLLTSNLISLNYTVSGLTNGVLYYFVISANGDTGESGNSVAASARPVSMIPPLLGYVVNGNEVQFSWPTDHTGWILQSQASSLDTGIGTNWVAVAGSDLTNQMIIPMTTSAIGGVFFRLIGPN